MAVLTYLHRCSYWIFLLSATTFLIVALLLMHSFEQTAAMLYPFLLYATVTSMLLSISLRITLWVGRPQQDENGSHTASTLTLTITFGACLLVSCMIAALLFFL